MTTADNQGALADLRVVEMGSFIADPFSGQLLADLGVSDGMSKKSGWRAYAEMVRSCLVPIHPCRSTPADAGAPLGRQYPDVAVPSCVG